MLIRNSRKWRLLQFELAMWYRNQRVKRWIKHKGKRCGK